MAIIHDAVSQGSAEWLSLRLGIPTASEFSALLTPKFAEREGKGRDTYMHKKLAERILGHCLPGFDGSFSTEHGNEVEDQARAWFELERDVTIRQVGFVTTDDGKSGASPDGLIGDDEGLELKCPAFHTHVGNCLAATVPDDYLCQVHGSLYVTGRKRWHFLSYAGSKFPKLVVTVERDESIMRKIGDALASFTRDFDKALSSLKPTKPKA